MSLLRVKINAMRKVYSLTAAVLLGFAASAQSLTPTVIASTGGFSQNANGSLSYTVGEMTMVETFSANGNILTQGFQQPNDISVGLIDMAKGEFGSFIVYPNPAVDKLWFGFEMPKSGEVTIALYNTLGQKIADVLTTTYLNGKTVETLDVTLLAAGAYYLSLTFNGQDGQTAFLSKQFQVIY